MARCYPPAEWHKGRSRKRTIASTSWTDISPICSLYDRHRSAPGHIWGRNNTLIDLFPGVSGDLGTKYHGRPVQGGIFGALG